MEKFKKLFTNSRLGIGAAIGGGLGYIMGSPTNEMDGVFAVIMVVALIVIVVENMFFAKK